MSDIHRDNDNHGGSSSHNRRRDDRHERNRDYDRDRSSSRRDRGDDRSQRSRSDHRQRRSYRDEEGQGSFDQLPSSGPSYATEKEFDDSKAMKLSLSFEEMGIKPDLLKGLYQFGITKPSAIQQRVMGPILSGQDLIAQAPSGTGKTTIFAIAMLQLVDTSINATQALALFPTRELAQQTHISIRSMGSYLNIKCHVAVGGHATGDDVNVLTRGGAQIVCGTPGRIEDLIKQGAITTRNIKVWVIDEADEMLGKGLKDQVYSIYRYLPSETQILLVSATLPNTVLALTSKFMVNPTRILVKRDELSLDGIKQFFVLLDDEEWKFETLLDLYDALTISQAVVFVNTREKAESLSSQLRDRSFTVGVIHGGLDQTQREEVMLDFRSTKTRILIATDVWGRGLDVQQLSLVINYDLPTSRETYLHRIGRSGRFGRKGVAINFVVGQEKLTIDDIAQYYGIMIEEMPTNVDQ